jgi:3-oxoacyl-(acyl-carrier-protein) synthase/acyl carrier protein
MKKDIAIIGIAGRFPDANHLDQLVENLENGKDSVREISPQRVKATTLPPGKKYKVCGYLEDIDKFDHVLFNISMAEAETMSPVQRLLLEIAYHTIENSGYRIDDFSGSYTSVYVAKSDSNYHYHAAGKEYSPTLVTGNSPEFFAAAISRQFNLKGNAAVIDASCASALAAVDAACNELILGNADTALVLAVNLDLFPFAGPDGLGLNAADGKSKAFSAQADGMSFGEVAAGILLKPLDRAREDRDIIHAVIKGIAVNNNAARSSSLTAPDSVMQAEVIRKAWQRAGIEPTAVGYIEAHGSGTQLGDSLEVEGLNRAFAGYTDKKRICPISTIKSNVGHGRTAAGIAGLLKAVLSLKHRELFPTIHFEAPNPTIDFQDSAVYVNEKLKKWETQDNAPRIAGVSSMGANGVNCHVVLQEAPAPALTAKSKSLTPGPYLVAVSSQTLAGLQANLSRLYYCLERPGGEDYPLADIAFTLNRGRKHYQYRFACIVHDVKTLKKEIRRSLDQPVQPGLPPKLNRLIFIFSAHREIPRALIDYFLSNHPVFRRHYFHCRDLYESPGDKGFRDFAFQYSLYKLLEAYGMVTEHILGTGSGKIVTSVITGVLSLEQGLKRVQAQEPGVVDMIEGLAERVAALLERETGKGSPIFIEMGPPSVLSRALAREKHPDETHWEVLALPVPRQGDNPGSPLLQLMKALVVSGYDIRWQEYYNHHDGTRIELPGYVFEKTRCWLREEPGEIVFDLTGMSAGRPKPVLKEKGTGIQEKIAGFWQEVLEIHEFSLEDDFFELGGDSLKATRVINHINKETGLNLSFEDLFDFPTIGSLSRYIDTLWTTEEKLALTWKEVLKVEKIGANDSFFHLGGHSLMANQVLNRIKQQFNLRLDFEDFYRNPTLKELSQYIESRLPLKNKETPGQTGEAKIAAAEKREYYPLSSAQKRMYLLYRLAPDHVNYNTPYSVMLEGPLGREKLENAFRCLITRHENLRTSFHMKGDEPVQVIQPTGSTAFNLDYDELPAEKVKDLLTRYIQPFDLSQLPSMRVLLAKTGKDRYVLCIDMHHIIIDGFSFIHMFIPELLAIYKGEELPVPMLQYKDFSQWQAGTTAAAERARQRDYWLNRFQDEIPVLNLPMDYQRPAIQVFEGKTISFRLETREVEGLMAGAARGNATLFMVLLTVFTILLSKLSGQEDIVVGTPAAGRTSADLEKIIGLFVNVLAQRNYPGGDKTIALFLEEVRDRTLAAFKNQDYPFEDLVEQVAKNRDASRNPLFDVMLLMQSFNTPAADTPLEVESPNQDGRLKITPYPYENKTSKYDLILICGDMDIGKNLTLTLEYNTRLFKPERVQRMIEDLKRLIRTVGEDPGIKIKDLRLELDPTKAREKNLYGNVEFNI